MAEPQAAPPYAAAAAEQDVLLATKLHVPAARPGFVARPRLVGALGEGLARGLVLVCAPAGFGKTALLADWARSGDRPVAWLSLDADDEDPVRFWRHVVAALDRARPGIGERVGPLLGPPLPSFEGLVTALINELAAQPGEDETMLVLDDYHLVDAQPVHASLAFLLEHLPPGLRLVLASRSDPPLPLPRLRAGGQLAELRAGELRFTAEEAAGRGQQHAVLHASTRRLAKRRSSRSRMTWNSMSLAVSPPLMKCTDSALGGRSSGSACGCSRRTIGPSSGRRTSASGSCWGATRRSASSA